MKTRQIYLDTKCRLCKKDFESGQYAIAPRRYLIKETGDTDYKRESEYGGYRKNLRLEKEETSTEHIPVHEDCWDAMLDYMHLLLHPSPEKKNTTIRRKETK